VNIINMSPNTKITKTNKATNLNNNVESGREKFEDEAEKSLSKSGILLLNGDDEGSEAKSRMSDKIKNLASRPNIMREFWTSKDVIFENKITWLLVLAPFALFGDHSTSRGQTIGFALSGLTLIPCAERLSYVTEQVAEHTNGTIGALLNATFGNAPELLIATAALRNGYYRVVQLAMLGSIMSNLLLVFGMACLVGGLRFQVQELRITSGNINVLMLLIGTAGSLLPAALFMSGQLPSGTINYDSPTKEELQFSRVNAFVLIIMYLCFLIFQLGTHKEEFDEDILQDKLSTTQRNIFCQKVFSSICNCCRGFQKNRSSSDNSGYKPVLLKQRSEHEINSDSGHGIEDNNILMNTDNHETGELMENKINKGAKRRKNNSNNLISKEILVRKSSNSSYSGSGSGSVSSHSRVSESSSINSKNTTNSKISERSNNATLSLRVGLIWLFIITLCISSMSDILVDTLQGFAKGFRLSGVFTSIIIVPYFSNVAEQVSAIIFAYRNEMDLCVGVTVGSAIQIATFVLPGSVLIGMLMDRSMTLFFHGYETACLFISVLVVAIILHGGKTNWLVGVTLIGIYIILSTGFWLHEHEILNIDAELVIKDGILNSPP